MHTAIRHGGRSLWGGVVVAVAILFILGPSANADFIGTVLTVEASSSLGSASQSWDLPAGASGDLQWTLDERCEFLGPGNEFIGSINNAVVGLMGDPVVSLSFAVNAGNAATTFTLTTALVSFSPLTNVTAYASAGVTLTDGNALPGNGASLDLVPPRTGLYQATYNGGTTFIELLASQSKSGPGSISAASNSGILSIAGAVTDIQASYSFTLSADDDASGTSRFEVTGVPEPSTFALLLCGFVGVVMGLGRRLSKTG